LRTSSSTAITIAPRMSTWTMSESLTPSTLPNRMWKRSTWDGITLTSTSPSANRPVKTMPIAASSLTRLVRLSPPIRPTAPAPNTNAPAANGAPIT
jgi:hypothetical protein